MRRSSVVLFLCLVLLVCGIYELAASWRGGAGLPGIAAIGSPRMVLGLVCVIASILAAVVGLVSLRRACSRLAKCMEMRDGAGSGDRVPLTHPDLNRLVEGVNEIIDASGRGVAEAQMRCKELEIQLKVATAERQHAEAIIYSISDAVLVTDPFDELVLANDSAAKAFNFDLGSASRAPIDKVLGDPKMIGLIREMRQSGSGGGRGSRRIVEHKVQTPAGERVFKVTMSCVGGGSGFGVQGSEEKANLNQELRTLNPQQGVVAVLHDMTREKEVAEMKNDFVSNVSHELRTPLASLKAYAEMLIDGEANDERTRGEFYEVIQNEANRLGRLIDNILNISRIESGLVKINKRPLSLMVLLKEASEVIAPQAKQKQIEVVEDIAPAFRQVMGDRDMLYESILNLMSNAVKYTPEGGRITLQTVVDESEKKVSARISDTGVGIPPKDLPFVFDKFYRSEANNRMAKGTGLGLSLVKHIIETVHHGRLFVESEVGKGSTFGFELELAE